MAYEFTELEPLATRKVTHLSQIRDNEESDNMHKLLVGQRNTFFATCDGGYITLSRPFENEFTEPLEDLVAFLRTKFGYISFKGFPKEVLESHYFTITSGESKMSWRLYQTPKTVEEYESKVKRFKNSGFEYRRLDVNGIPKIIELTGVWANTKKELALKLDATPKLESVKDIDTAISQLQRIRSEVDWLDYMVKDPKTYEKLMKQPLTAFYGAFKDGELVAYLQTIGNDSFQAFTSRSSKRTNSCSPQEFLDLVVARDFVKRGVPLFDRGWLNIRQGMIGLIEYKKKFGEVMGRFELDRHGVYYIDTPENKYLKELFAK